MKNELAVKFFELAVRVAENILLQDMKKSEKEQYIINKYEEHTEIHQIASVKHFRTKVIADIYEIEIQE